MRRFGPVCLGGCIAVLGLGLLATIAARGVPASAQAPADAKALVGTWKVDLRPRPDAEAYFKEFRVDAVDGKRFTGEFYGTAIEEGRVNADWGDVHFAFVTRDNSGPYHHAGVLRGGKLVGQSNSLGRDFLNVWRADRAD